MPRMSRTPSPSSVTPALMLWGLVLAGSGCPAKAPTPESQAQAGHSPAGVPVTADSDPRVVRDGEDLYASEDAPVQPPTAAGLGAGRPDTTNGECKLFAPKLAEPACCPFETGFDADKVQKLCGHALYMGESLQQSCGYYFLHDETGGVPVALRVSKLMTATVDDAAANHDMRLAQISKRPDFASTPVPGLEGAKWSTHDGIHWAFLPGWSTVRLVSWTDDACPDAAMPEVLKVIAGSREVPAHAPRQGLVPKARE